MAKYLDPSIGATMLLSFALTYAYLYWERPSAPRAAIVSSVAASATELPSLPSRPAPPAAVSDSEVTLASRPAAESTAAPRPVRSSVAVAAVAEYSPVAATPLPSLPIQVTVFNRRQQNKIEGVIQNMSRDHLSLTLRGQNAEGQFTSQGHIELEAYQRKSFGTDSGMALQEQDDLIVQSSGYADMSSHVP